MIGSKKIRIVTHNLKFHTDDVFAVATLTLLLGESNVEIIRTRDEKMIETADYVVDVGLIYNYSNKRFDHHQKGGAGSRENGIPFASFGLVWKHYGMEICKNERIFKKIDEILVQPIDAGDNGYEIYTLKGGVNPYTIHSFISSFNPSWKNDDLLRMDEFMQVVSIAKSLILREIGKLRDLLEANEIVLNLYNNSTDKRLIIMDKYYPFNDVLTKLNEPLFVVFPRGDGRWTLKTVQYEEGDYKSKKYLPKEWSGLNNSELENISGVKGAISCHNNLFIAIADSKESILKMAEIALNS